MIRLSNGYKFDFVVSSGALGYDGKGYLWEWPLRWMGLIDPTRFLVITKTLTFKPRKGNLRWWAPWRCVRLIPGDGAVNAVGLTNIGIVDWAWWRFECYGECDIAVSVMPETISEANSMASVIYARIAGLPSHSLAAIEFNASCPNVSHEESIEHICEICKRLGQAGVPVIVKLGWQQPYMEIIRELEKIDCVEAYDLINTVPWNQFDYNQPSPLARYGLTGGVSGAPICNQTVGVLEDVKRDKGIRKPVISGGGVMSLLNVEERFVKGADAVAFGTLFLRRPWMPNKLARQWREGEPILLKYPQR